MPILHLKKGINNILYQMFKKLLTMMVGIANAAKLPDGFEVSITSETVDKLKFEVTIKKESWFAIGFGQAMDQVDMVLFQKDGVTDLWSTGYFTPVTDDTQNYVDTTKTEDGDSVKLVTYRDRITSDKAQDF